MARAWLPVGFTVLLLLGLSAWEAVLSDRFRGSGIPPEVVKERFDKVPMTLEVGGVIWAGEDKKVDEETLRVAGAVNHINRSYTNDAGQQVDMWLICGHARDVCRHTPNICYPAQGFRPAKTQILHEITAPGEKPAVFWTTEFMTEKGGTHRVRVFWSWNGNDPEGGHTTWEAPSENPRPTYGNNTALYKLYFTTSVTTDEDEANDSVAVDFAKLMLPEINKALFPEDAADMQPSGEPDSAASKDDEASQPAAEEEAAAEEAAAA